MSQYNFQTSAEAVTDAVMTVANSAAPIYEFAVGPALDAAVEAASLGFLRAVGNGAFEMAHPGSSVAMAKDRVGYVMNFADISVMTKAYRGAWHHGRG